MNREEFDAWLHSKESVSISAFWIVAVKIIAWVLIVTVAVAFFAPLIMERNQ